MIIEGSCHCGRVSYTVDSAHAVPFNHCYCSICRKTAGGGGSAVNLGADFNTLKVDGEEHISVYRALKTDPATGDTVESQAQRHFCRHCGSALWLYDPRWPGLVHPHASAIDTDLPVPPQRTHMMLNFKANWVTIGAGDRDRQFDEYPDESLEQWHKRNNITC